MLAFSAALRLPSLILFLLSATFGFAQLTTLPVEVVCPDQPKYEKKIARWVGSARLKPDTFLLAQKSEEIVSNLFSKGFVAASVDSVSVKLESITFHVMAGSKFELGSIDYQGVPEELVKKALGRSIKEGEVLSPKTLARQKGRIIGYFENRGFPFTSATLDSVSLNDGRLSAKMIIDKGPEIKIDSVVVKGSSKVRPKYIQTYLGIRPDDLYNESRIRNVSTRIKELPFVAENRDPIVRFEEDKAKLYLFLDKRKASEFDGILGVLPNNEDPGKILVTGELKLKLLSAFGRGELISLQWQKLQARTQRLDVQLTVPFLFNTPFGIDGSFNLYKRDTLFLNLLGKGGIMYQMRGGDHLSVFVDARTTNVIARSTLINGSGTLKPDFVDSQILLYGFGANISCLDYRFNPRKGFDVVGEVSAGTKTIDKDATVPPERYDGLASRSFIANAKLEANYFIPIAKRQTIRIGLKGGYIFSDQLFESEMFRIGGLKTLRGFDEESVYADLYSIGTVEYRFLIDRNSFAFAFFDGAYYEFNGVNNDVTDRPFGFGLGVNFETKIGIFSVTYALGKQFNNPIDFRTGKLHFGIVNRF